MTLDVLEAAGDCEALVGKLKLILSVIGSVEVIVDVLEAIYDCEALVRKNKLILAVIGSGSRCI